LDWSSLRCPDHQIDEFRRNDDVYLAALFYRWIHNLAEKSDSAATWAIIAEPLVRNIRDHYNGCYVKKKS